MIPNSSAMINADFSPIVNAVLYVFAPTFAGAIESCKCLQFRVSSFEQ